MAGINISSAEINRPSLTNLFIRAAEPLNLQLLFQAITAIKSSLFDIDVFRTTRDVRKAIIDPKTKIKATPATLKTSKQSV